MAMMLDAKRERSYPELERGDKVRIKQKKKVMDKETTLKWSKEVYTITLVTHDRGGTHYALDGVSGYLMRHELLKVEN